MRPTVETILFSAGSRRLEGRWRNGGAGSAVIAPPHPEYGGRLDHPVVELVADALAGIGMATLAFNWSGVGSSEGDVSGDVGQADADYTAALDELARRGSASPIVAAGYSFGAATALRLANRVDQLVLVAPPVALIGGEDLKRCERPMTVLLGDADGYAPLDVASALMPKHAHARLTILPATDHFFGTPGALERLARGLAAALG